MRNIALHRVCPLEVGLILRTCDHCHDDLNEKYSVRNNKDVWGPEYAPSYDNELIML